MFIKKYFFKIILLIKAWGSTRNEASRAEGVRWKAKGRSFAFKEDAEEEGADEEQKQERVGGAEQDGGREEKEEAGKEEQEHQEEKGWEEGFQEERVLIIALKFNY